jgi:biopolymer transport protein ExbD
LIGDGRETRQISSGSETWESTMAVVIAGNEGRSYSDINMTPLIDVMLVLLIIFIITIPSQTHAVKIDNPAPQPPPRPTPPEVIDLSIDFDGTLLWNKTPVNRTTLQGYISQEATKTPQPEVHIRVDKFSKYEIVAQTLADLQHRGLNKIGFVNNDLF